MRGQIQPQAHHREGLARRVAGVTLIELMVVVAIIGILSAIAYPSYVQSILRGRRSDAKTALLDLATRQERFMTTNNVYASTPAQLGYVGSTFPINIQTGGDVYYTMSITVPTTTTFTATATPTDSQSVDACGAYTLNHLGSQTNTGSLAAAKCW